MDISFLIQFIGTFVLFLMVCYIIITCLTRILFFISEQTTLARIYHQIVLPEEDGENFSHKIIKMCACNFNLSIPVILTFMFIIKNTVGSNFNSNTAFEISLILTIGTFYSMRILSNPTKSSFKPKLLSLLRGQPKIDEIKIYQERMVSFFFSFISATLIFILVAFLYSMFTTHSQGSILTDLAGLIMPSVSFSFVDFGMLFFCYTVLLAIFTIYGEFQLKRNVPLLQLK